MGITKREVLVSSTMAEVVKVVFRYSFFFFFYKKIFEVIDFSSKRFLSVVLMLHADEADCFLTCRLSNLCLKINEEHHCNNLPVSLKIKHCNESCERCKAIKDKKCSLARWFYTDGDRYIRCNNRWCEVKLNDTSKPCEHCFCQGCGFEKDDQDEKLYTDCNEGSK